LKKTLLNDLVLNSAIQKAKKAAENVHYGEVVIRLKINNSKLDRFTVTTAESYLADDCA